MQTIQIHPFGNRCHIRFGSLSFYGYCGINGVTRQKQEGDGKTPVGTFMIPFGFYRSHRPRTQLPMLPLHPQHRWIDQPDSPLYNRLVFGNTSYHSERLWEYPQYALGLVLHYNRSPVIPYAGSAIFMHCGNRPTAGCIALAYDSLLQMMERLTLPPFPQVTIED